MFTWNLSSGSHMSNRALTEELDDDGKGQSPNSHRLFALKKAHSIFVTNQLKPFCKLLIVGDYEYNKDSKPSKKQQLIQSSNIDVFKVKDRKMKDHTVDRDGVYAMIFEFSHYDRIVATPAYKFATMIAIIPNSAEDLRIWYNSISNPMHRPNDECKIVCLNLFDLDSEEYKSIDSKIDEINKLVASGGGVHEFTRRLEKFTLKSISLDELINYAVRHTLEMIEKLTRSEPNNHPNGLGSANTGSGLCSIL